MSASPCQRSSSTLLFTPLFGYLLGKIFFPGSLDIRIGLLIELPVLSVISGILKRWNQE